MARMWRAGLLLALCPCAFGLNPALDVSQYAHTAWKLRDGFSQGVIETISQTPDGYLWLGTEFGLIRFDGVRTVAWQPPPDRHLPSDHITKLLSARDGTLWIGTLKGLTSWKNGKLTEYGDLAGSLILALIEDRQGTIWAGTAGIPNGKLCEIQRESVHCYGQDGRFGTGVLSLEEDAKANLWVGLRTGVWRWKPDPPKFVPVPGEASYTFLGEDSNGTVLIGRHDGIRRMAEGKTEAYRLPGSSESFSALNFLRDRDGGLWIGVFDRGLVHVHQGKTDAYTVSEGLSGNSILALFEDHEGNLWLSTNGGLDCFRDLAIATFSSKQGLPESRADGVLAASDGTIWLGGTSSLTQWNHGRVTIFHKPGSHSERAPLLQSVRDVPVRGLLDERFDSLLEDGRGRLWMSTPGGTGYIENGRFISIRSVPAGFVNSMVNDEAGNLWIANQDHGLVRLSPDNEVADFPWASLGRQDYAYALAADPLRGGIWIGFYQSGLAWFHDGKVAASYSSDLGLGKGSVNQLRFDSQGALWAATESGLSRLKSGHIATLTSRNGLPCDTVHWTIEDDAQSVWLYMPCGLVRVPRSELDAAIEDKAGRTIHTTIFDSSDGVRGIAELSSYTPHVSKSRDGQMWFTSVEGLQVIDPGHLPVNRLPPPMHVETVKIDGKETTATDGLELSHSAKNIEIAYTALSFRDPDRVRFEYKLEGQDGDWIDVGTRRVAYYNRLEPRQYRFRVIASNDSGVWNEAGVSWNFRVVPAYYQTIWFRSLVVAAVLALMAWLYQLRLRYLKHQFNIRLEARVGERTRIARDLHDTLLQSFQAVLLKFSTIKYMMRDRPDEAEETLERYLDQARAAITEGRDAVQGLRSSMVVANDLARAITTFGEGLVSDHAGPNCPEFRVYVRGKSRDLPPLVRDEVYKIACECLRNAFRHAQAQRIEVEIRYDQRQFRSQVVDNGKGIDPAVLSAGGSAGHHGLPGLHERAELAGGKLSVWSQLGSGTEIELTVPASIAYQTPAPAKPMSAGKGH
jgi:signal transduction histidine kinase/ligand-binding sensor domain-containing protein